ncbi:MAG: zinc ABC transporter substrate-binding protein [Aggregatilineales bacterium]
MLRLLLVGICFGLSFNTFAQSQPFRIVATTTQAADLVAILAAGAQDVSVVGLMGPGVDPHLYQPTESDIAAMNQADVVVYNGLHLEGQFGAVFRALSERSMVIIGLGEIAKEAGFIVEVEDEAGVDDPHFWFDPLNWALVTEALAERLAARNPVNAAVYRQNAAAYVAQLERLNEWALAAMQSIPEDQRILLTSHDAFFYFATAFGWRVSAVQGISTEAEAGVGDIQAVVQQILSERIPVVFVESSVPPNTIRAVVEAVTVAGGRVQMGVRELYSDAMGDPESFGGTYIGMIAENVYTILQSFACAGIDVMIPAWPEDLTPQPPDELFEVSCPTA